MPIIETRFRVMSHLTANPTTPAVTEAIESAIQIDTAVPGMSRNEITNTVPTAEAQVKMVYLGMSTD
jgi:N-acetylmuramic acid 6-phosphate (MurNAc-6-P) etherase